MIIVTTLFADTIQERIEEQLILSVTTKLFINQNHREDVRNLNSNVF